MLLEDEMSLRSIFYMLAKFLGDYNAVKNGTVGKRIGRRVAGRATGKMLGSIFRKF